MEKQLFILFFIGAVPLVLPITYEYYLIQEPKNWTDAQLYCQAEHTDLAIIKTTKDVMNLQNETQKYNFNSTAWIGMYLNISAWRWSLGYEQVGTMRKWSSGEPNNRGGTQNCGAITPGGWWDMQCAQTKPFLCYDDTKTGSDRYIYISNMITWPAAQAYCRQYHTDLSSSRDETENSILMKLISGVTWFGIYREPWKWTDHSNFSTISWMSGKPDNYNWNQNCGYLSNGRAVDEVCSVDLPFYCYSAPKTQHIISIKIKSSQDLNDPAVNAAILDMINQKLKDHGIDKHTVVRWRVNPDGEVFQKEREKKTQ